MFKSMFGGEKFSPARIHCTRSSSLSQAAGPAKEHLVLLLFESPEGNIKKELEAWPTDKADNLACPGLDSDPLPYAGGGQKEREEMTVLS